MLAWAPNYGTQAELVTRRANQPLEGAKACEPGNCLKPEDLRTPRAFNALLYLAPFWLTPT